MNRQFYSNELEFSVLNLDLTWHQWTRTRNQVHDLKIHELYLMARIYHHRQSNNEAALFIDFSWQAEHDEEKWSPFR